MENLKGVTLMKHLNIKAILDGLFIMAFFLCIFVVLFIVVSSNQPKLDSAIAYYRGIVYYVKGQYDKTISDDNKVIEIIPKDAFAYYNRGYTYWEKGQFDKAISDYNKAIEINPGYAEAYFNRGIAYDNKGQHDKAMADYNKAIELNPRYSASNDNRELAYFNKRENEVFKIRFFEGEKKPKNSERIYKNSFDKATTRYVYTELKMNNLQYKGNTHEHEVIWIYYNPNGSLRGRIEGNFNVKPEWATAWIYRGWGWPSPGNWPVGIYRVVLFIDGVKIGDQNFTIK